MTTSPRANYHHGDLRTALVLAAETIIRDEGIEGYSLRKVTGLAGVSPGALAHHFAGSKGLLTTVAARGYAKLGERIGAVPMTGQSAHDLRAMALAYVAFAAENPGRFKLMGRQDLIDYDDADLFAVVRDAMAPLIATAAAHAGVTAADPGGLGIDPAIIATMAAIHGTAHMSVEGRWHRLAPLADSGEGTRSGLLKSIFIALWPDPPG